MIKVMVLTHNLGGWGASVEAARARWSEGKAKGLDVTYWRPDEEGRWQRLG